MTEKTKSLAMDFMGRFPGHISARLLATDTGQGRGYRPHVDRSGRLTGFIELENLIGVETIDAFAAIFEAKEEDVNVVDITRRIDLLLPAVQRQTAVVKMQLDREDVNPNPPLMCGLSPLTAAVLFGQEAAVKILLERGGLNSDEPQTIFGLTLLSCAVFIGYQGIVKLLLE